MKTGYPKDEAIGKTTADLDIWINPDDRRQFVSKIKETGKIDNLETCFRHKNGPQAPCLISARIIEIAGSQCIISMTRDISERKKTEEMLLQYERIVSTSNDLMAMVDRDYIYRAVNDAYLEAHAKKREDFIGFSIPALMGHDVFLKAIKANFDRALAGHEIHYEDWFDFPGWGSKYMHVTYYPFLDENQKITGVVVNSRDITHTKELESQLLQSQKLEAIGTLAGGLAHDFNNLLMGIQGRASLMLADMEHSHPHLEHVKGIEEYVESATDLTKQLLGFARGGKYEVKSTDIPELIAKTARMFGRTRKEINIVCKNEDHIWPVDADRRQIEQVLLNLFVNAWQAMPGGGDLYIQTENINLAELSLKPRDIEPGNYVKVSITDTGVGMDNETRLKIFDPFFTTKDRGRGTGLGLASAYGIVRHHAGNEWQRYLRSA